MGIHLSIKIEEIWLAMLLIPAFIFIDMNAFFVFSVNFKKSKGGLLQQLLPATHIFSLAKGEF